MLISYFQNANAGVSKDTYFEICEQLGSEPIESEIPVEFEDFPAEIQEAINIYSKLRDEWDGFSGMYMGKNFSGLKDILDIYQVDTDNRQNILEWILMLDRVRSKLIADSRPKDAK